MARAAGGTSCTTPEGYFGAGCTFDNTKYGVPFIEAGGRADPPASDLRVRGEARNLGGVFEAFRDLFAVQRYRHEELVGEVSGRSS